MIEEFKVNNFISDLQSAIVRLADSSKEVSFREVYKNNGVKMNSCTIREKDAFVAPTLYLESFYPMYREGYTVDDIAIDIISAMEKIEIPKFISSDIMDRYEEVREHLFIKLVGYNANREIIEDGIFFQIEDLAAVVYYMTGGEGFGSGLIALKKDMLADWNVEEEQVYQDALENSAILQPAAFKNIKDVLQLGGMDTEEDNCSLYILTNEDACLGASAIIYPDVLHSISKRLDADLIILPSSIHEVIILADHGEDRRKLHEMVFEINHTQVNPQEILTDSVYQYSRENREFSKCRLYADHVEGLYF